MSFDSTANEGRRLTSIRNLALMPGYRDAFSDSSLRHLVFQSKSRTNSRGETVPGNGLEEAGVVLRIGRKVLIDLDRFDAWLASHRTPVLDTETTGLDSVSGHRIVDCVELVNHVATDVVYRGPRRAAVHPRRRSEETES